MKSKLLVLFTLMILFLVMVCSVFSFQKYSPKNLLSLIKKPEPAKASILFTGDLMMDRYIRQVAMQNSHGYNFSLENVKDLFSSKDLVVSDLECPITTNKSLSIYSKVGSRNNFIFTCDPLVVDTLESHKIKMVNIGNNHILNQGTSGLEQTKRYLDERGISYFDGNTSAIKDINGIKIGFAGYNQFSGDTESKSKTIEELKQLRTSVDIVVVYTHWGNEYQSISSTETQELARRFIDAGADVVIGSHPHVIQQIEDYKGKKIYYSLGNFVMDQYFSAETQKGMLVEMNVTKKDNNVEVDFTEQYVKMLPTTQTILAK